VIVMFMLGVAVGLVLGMFFIWAKENHTYEIRTRKVKK